MQFPDSMLAKCPTKVAIVFSKLSRINHFKTVLPTDRRQSCRSKIVQLPIDISTIIEDNMVERVLVL